MKNFFVKINLIALLVAGLALQSCKTKDSDIQSSYQKEISNDAQLSSISATVNDGIITLTGQCPDQACRTNAEEKAKKTKGVKSVVNNISVGSPAPVVIEDDAALRTSVNNVVRNFPGVNADVNGGIVTLRGNIARNDLQRLMPQLHALNPKNIDNQLTVN
ncbi:MAG: BON domain-containing protein [Chitinophagaceae bacterium]